MKVSKLIFTHASAPAASMANSRERGEAMDAITHALMVRGADAAMAFPNSMRGPSVLPSNPPHG